MNILGAAVGTGKSTSSIIKALKATGKLSPISTKGEGDALKRTFETGKTS